MTEIAERNQPGNGALALRSEQAWWSERQIAVLQSTGIDDDVSQPELMAFLHTCQRTGLDPFARQIYLVGRYDSKKGRKVYTPQTSIDGYRVVAQRTSERTNAALSYEDTLWCGPDGQWTDVWLASEPPTAAKIAVHRGSGRFSAVALWSEYVPLKDGKPMGLWSKMPAVMVAKCAEALALRKAFPNDLSGIYTAEEMAQATDPAGASSPSQSTWPTECSDCHFTHRVGGVCPVGEPGPTRTKNGGVRKDSLTKAERDEQKRVAAELESLAPDNEPGRVQRATASPDPADPWAQGVVGPALDLPDGDAAKLAKQMLAEIEACATVEMVDTASKAARKARSDDRLTMPQLGTLIAACAARVRELESQAVA